MLKILVFNSSGKAAAGVGGIVAGAAGTGVVDKAVKAVLVGYLAGITNRYFRQRGNSMVAVTADKLSRVAEQSPEFVSKFGDVLVKAAKKGPAALSATHHVLMKNKDYSNYFSEEEQP